MEGYNATLKLEPTDDYQKAASILKSANVKTVDESDL